MTNGKRPEVRELASAGRSLFRLVLGPVIWATHFLWSYVAAAIYCAKFAADGDTILTLRTAVLVGGAVALVILVYLGWRAWKQWDYAEGHEYTHDGSVAEDRHEFLGHAALLLVIVSVIGVIYTSLPALYLETCR